MKTLVIDLGTQISHHLTELLLLVAVSAKWKGIIEQLDDVAAILELLSMEENSIVIKGFLFVVKLLEKT